MSRKIDQESKNDSQKQMFVLLNSFKLEILGLESKLQNILPTLMTRRMIFQPQEGIENALTTLGETRVETFQCVEEYKPNKTQQVQVPSFTHQKPSKFSDSGNYLQECLFSSAAWDIAVIPGEDKAVVTLPVQSSIQIIDIKTFSAGSIYPVPFACWVITIVNGKICVGGQKIVYILDQQGKQLKKVRLPNDCHITNLHSGPMESIYYTDRTCDAVCHFTLEGEERFRYTSVDLKGPNEVATDKSGRLYVACEKSNNIQRIVPNGEFQDIILNTENDIYCPTDILFSKDYRKLYVLNHVEDNIIKGDMAEAEESKEEFYLRLLTFVIGPATEVLQLYFEIKVLNSLDFFIFLENNKHVLFHELHPSIPCCECKQVSLATPRKKCRLNEDQFDTLFETDEVQGVEDHKRHERRQIKQLCLCSVSAKRTASVDLMDITLLSSVIKSCCQPGSIAGNPNWIKDIKKTRNFIAHSPRMKITKSVFEQKFALVEQSVLNLASVVGPVFILEMFVEKQTSTLESFENQTRNLVENAQEIKTEVLSRLQEQKEDLFVGLRNVVFEVKTLWKDELSKATDPNKKNCCMVVFHNLQPKQWPYIPKCIFELITALLQRNPDDRCDLSEIHYKLEETIDMYSNHVGSKRRHPSFRHEEDALYASIDPKQDIPMRDYSMDCRTSVMDIANSRHFGDPFIDIVKKKNIELVLKMVKFVIEMNRCSWILGSVRCADMYLSNENDQVVMARLGRMLWFDRSGLEDDYVIASQDCTDNMRWCPIEVLQFKQYSFASDVYSLAMTIYEFFMTLSVNQKDPMAGELDSAPFPNVALEDLRDNLFRDCKPDQPEACPEWLYEHMCRCWSKDKDKRPTCGELYTIIEKHLRSAENVSEQDQYDKITEQTDNNDQYDDILENGATNMDYLSDSEMEGDYESIPFDCVNSDSDSEDNEIVLRKQQQRKLKQNK
ncbi:unnamed protein product [Mytilus edulis]|uniref:Tyrosine-protein kinase catalytic domain-containing protein n=1 Tax=Mytilus edulis TaxID=6550 RepID=A0A8S3TNJ7_MYTED|nr:unnamed protein product [Mytilus edulis]